MRPATPVPAFDLLGTPGAAPLVVSCEHASNAVPSPWRTTAADRAWLRTHWGWDIGAATVATRLAANLGAPALLATVSRLVVDLNRAPDAESLALPTVEGVPLGFNAGLDAAGREARIADLHVPYHQALDRLTAALAARRGPALLFSVHSFTPCYLGSPREMEMGVLFDDHEDLARRLCGDLEALGWDCRLNEPWSGRAGLIYSARRHGRAHAVPYLELEIRQDLIEDEDDALALADRLVEPVLGLLAG